MQEEKHAAVLLVAMRLMKGSVWRKLSCHVNRRYEMHDYSLAKEESQNGGSSTVTAAEADPASPELSAGHSYMQAGQCFFPTRCHLQTY